MTSGRDANHKEPQPPSDGPGPDLPALPSLGHGDVPRFDLHALFVAVDDERRARGLSWSGAANDIGVATSTIRRYGVADDAEADGVLAVLCWLGAAPEAFIEGVPGDGQPLQKPRSGYVRVDMEEVVRATGHRRAGDNRTRTTIQRLVESAQLADQSVASLTRVSDV